MQYISGLETYHDMGRSAVTLGKFDGLHKGHEKLISRVAELSEEYGMKSVVCAFDMLPFFEHLSLKKQVLMTKEERRFRLNGRVDYLVDCPFTEKFSRIEAENFIRDILVGIFHAAFVVVGADFRFGHDKRGDIHMLAEYAEKYEYRLIVIEKERYEGREISSTYVKEALRQGDMKLARELLGYSYGVTGTVEPGKKLGRTLGFPTFNVAPAPEKLLPPNGVYIDRVFVDGKWYNAIGNIGVKPTVSDSNRMLVESFLFGYEGNAYGKNVRVELQEFRRKEQKFSSVEEMKRCIDLDIEYGKKYFQDKR